MDIACFTNSFISIILFLIKNQDKKFVRLHYNDSFYMNKNSLSQDFLYGDIFCLSKHFEKIQNKILKFFFLLFSIPHVPIKILSCTLYKKNKFSDLAIIQRVIIVWIWFFSWFNLFSFIRLKIIINKIIKKYSTKNIHIFLHFDFFSYLFLKFSKNINIYCYDDGLSKYNKDYVSWLNDKRLIKKITKIYFIKNHNMKYNYTDLISSNYINKVELIDIKKHINDIKSEFDEIEPLRKNARIFLSQPLVNDNLLTEKDYITLVNDQINKFKINTIKIHPRDNFDYTKYFKNIKLIKNKTPYELLILQNEKISLISTVFSSNINIFQDLGIEIHFMGTKWNKNIEQKMGTFKEFHYR